jgi:GAF domain-containing protein
MSADAVTPAMRGASSSESSEPPPSRDAPVAHRSLVGIVLGHSSFVAVLPRAVELAKRAIPGADEVSVTMHEGSPVTVAATGRLAEEVDTSQYATDTGPCLEAIRSGITVLVEDQSTETRWPEYSRRALGAGIGSSLSVPLPVDGRPVGAFNIYATAAHAFDAPSQLTAEALGAYTGIVLDNAGLYFTAAAQAAQMAEAMATRAVIEQAKGMLMATRRCTADEAFEVLVRLSQKSGRKLRDIAKGLVEDALKQ